MVIADFIFIMHNGKAAQRYIIKVLKYFFALIFFVCYLCIMQNSSVKLITPLVYSCSGCSSAAQMANHIAIQLDRSEVAEMSCIAGVGGNVKKLVKTARSGRKIIAIDGCPLACSKACLANHGIAPDMHIELTGMGVLKKQHEDFDAAQAKHILEEVQKKVVDLSHHC